MPHFMEKDTEPESAWPSNREKTNLVSTGVGGMAHLLVEERVSPHESVWLPGREKTNYVSSRK
jgi:hypothetical protein